MCGLPPAVGTLDMDGETNRVSTKNLKSLDPRIWIIRCTDAPRNNNGVNLAIINWVLLLHYVIDVHFDLGLCWP